MKKLLSTSMSGSSADLHPPASSLPISGMAFGARASVDAVECPKCGKRSIVERSSNVFDCLNCGFHRELPPVSRRVTPTLSTSARAVSSLSVPNQILPSPLLNAQGHIQQRGLTHSNLNALLSSDATSSLDSFSLDMDEEQIAPDSSQPWIFAVIAVIFGILLL
ncbi:MAG: hypothetical protein AAF528_09370 [Cyanobacteria bacterium P01_C01_bin.121]